MSGSGGAVAGAAADVIAVDWSGSKQGGAIWSARARDGRLLSVEPHPSRDSAVQTVIDAGKQADGSLVVGFDFSFSFPAWFLDERGLASAPELWALVARDGEDWLASCDPPFWGRPGRRRPELRDHFRVTERALDAVAGIRPKSTFQIGGAGAVGTGSVRGMPYLSRLAEAGFSIWPFDELSPRLVVEIYPRLLTGPVVKRSHEARQAYLAQWVDDGSLPAALAGAAATTEDGFDAAVSALVMSRHAHSFAGLARASTRTERLEGAVWVPPGAAVPAASAVPSDGDAAAPPDAAYGTRYADALGFAARLHATQRRKGSAVPYLSHLLAVSALVWEAGGDEDQAIAGLLHDAVEDRGGEPTLVAIRLQFGERVAAMVEACTDSWTSPKPPWRARKEAHLDRLRRAPTAALLVVAADKLHNVTSTVADLRRDGPAVWDRFRGGRAGTCWYYRQVHAVLADRLPGPLVSRLGAAVAELEQFTAS